MTSPSILEDTDVPQTTFFANDKARLVALEGSHAQRISVWMSDADTLKFSMLKIPYPQSCEQASAMIASFQSANDGFFFGVENPEGEFIGYGGLGFIDWKDRSAMVGLTIGDTARRDVGFGTAALRLILAFGFRELNLHRIYGELFAFNQRSLRLCQNVGFQVEGVKRQACFRGGKYHDVLLIGVLANQQDVIEG